MPHLLLIGGGHAHAFVLEAFARQPEPGVSITLVTPSAHAPYSGMVPAWLAGDCRAEAMHLDMAWLAERAGARWINDSVATIQAAERRVELAGGDWLNYDLASVNVGAGVATPHVEASASGPRLLPMRPLDALQQRWPALLEDVASWPSAAPRRVLAVGAGAAGCETLMSALARLRDIRPDIDWHGTLLGASRQPLPDAGRLPGWLMHRQLRQAGIHWQGDCRAMRISAAGVVDDSDTEHAADLILWATGARGHAWLSRGDLRLDERGFIRVDKTLAVLTGDPSEPPSLWAAGDCAAFSPPLPKAGVYAVRMGPLLASNLRRACRGDDPQAYHPQRRVLALIGNGRGSATASRGALGISGRWVWHWKQRIDHRFIQRFSPTSDP